MEEGRNELVQKMNGKDEALVIPHLLRIAMTTASQGA
jgi:hypothetical protein